MKLNKFLQLVVVMVIMTVSVSAKESKTKIVYHCNLPDASRFHIMLNTMNNVVNEYERASKRYEIDLVVHASCLQHIMKDFKDTKFVKKPYINKGGPSKNGTSGRLKSLKKIAGKNLKIIACENAMKKKNVKASQMSDIVELTPSGIQKVIDLQRAGYIYLKI